MRETSFHASISHYRHEVRSNLDSSRASIEYLNMLGHGLLWRPQDIYLAPSLALFPDTTSIVHERFHLLKWPHPADLIHHFNVLLDIVSVVCGENWWGCDVTQKRLGSGVVILVRCCWGWLPSTQYPRRFYHLVRSDLPWRLLSILWWTLHTHLFLWSLSQYCTLLADTCNTTHISHQALFRLVVPWPSLHHRWLPICGLCSLTVLIWIMLFSHFRQRLHCEIAGLACFHMMCRLRSLCDWYRLILELEIVWHEGFRQVIRYLPNLLHDLLQSMFTVHHHLWIRLRETLFAH